MKRIRSIFGILGFLSSAVFPWIYIDFSIFNIYILENIGSVLYAKMLIVLGFFPFSLMLIFLWANRGRKTKLSIRRNIRELPYIGKVIIIIFSFLISVALCMGLPFSNIGYFQLQNYNLRNNDKVLSNIKDKGISDIYWQVSSKKGNRIYFNSSHDKTSEIISTILKEHGVSFKLEIINNK